RVVEAHRAHLAPARHRDAGYDRVVAERVLDGGDRAEVDVSSVEALRDHRWDLGDETEVRVALEGMNDGCDVQVRDGAEAKRRHHGTSDVRHVVPWCRYSHSLTTLKTVSRSTGR